MLKHLLQYLTALVVVFGAYLVYAQVAVPFIEPPAAMRKGAKIDSQPEPRSRHDLTALFPRGSWELNRPKQVEIGQGVLLVNEYKTSDDGVLHIEPCTLVLFTGREGDPRRRPIILQAPGGADLQFEDGADLKRARFGPLKGGQLIGEITIRSPETIPGAGDDVELVTRNVQIDRRRILAPHDVTFHYGPHSGRGRDLIITLSDEQPQRGEGPLSGRAALGLVETVELVHLDKITFRVNEGSMLPADLADRLPENRSSEAFSSGPAGRNAALSEVDITCAGPLVFDVVENRAWFEDRVAVTRHKRLGPPDSLTCHRLAIDFFNRETASGGESASSADPTALPRFGVAGIVATGKPPSATPRGDAAPDQSQVVVRYAGFWMETPRLEYQPPPDDPKGLGSLRAAGPGALSVQQADRQRPAVTARWSGELQLRPFEQSHVLSLYADSPGADDGRIAAFDRGVVEVNVDGQGSVSAGEMHVYLHEVAKSHPAAQTFWRIAARRDGSEANTDGSSTPRSDSGRTFIPDRMLAKRAVSFDSPLLVGDADDVKIWFEYGPAAPGAADRGPPLAALPAAPAARRNAGALQSRRYELHGELVQVKLLMTPQDPMVDDVTVTGESREASFAEAPRSGGERWPLNVRGQTLRLYDGASANPKLALQGRPANVSMRGLTITGADINLHRGDNRMWIEGPGSASMLGGSAGVAAPGRGPRRVMIAWRNGMNFDGLRVNVAGDVQVDGEHLLDTGDLLRSTAHGQAVSITLDRRVDFSRATAAEDVQPQLLTFTGPVQISNDTFDTAGQQKSREQMSVSNPTIQVQTGDIRAPGAGWISTVRYGRSLAPPGDSQPAGPLNGASGDKLTFLRINYKDGLSGNHLQRRITFHGVRALAFPAATFGDQIDPDRVDSLRKNEMLLTCRDLTVVDMGPSIGQRGALEMKASGDTVVRGKKYTATGDVVTYSQAKDMLVLQGSGRRKATLADQTTGGEPLTASAIRYFPSIPRFEFEGIESATFSN